MTFEKYPIVIGAALFTASLSLFAAEPSLTATPADLSTGNTRLTAVIHTNAKGPLASRDFRFPDGVRGEIISAPVEAKIYPDLPGLTEHENWEWASICAPVIKTVAIAQGSVSYLSDDRRLVFTKTDFVPRQDISVTGTKNIGAARIVVIRPGGEAVDNGEKVRVDYAEQTPFISGRSYLLSLSPSSNTGNVFYTTEDTAELTNGIVKVKKAWKGYPDGTPWSLIQADAVKILKKKPCPTR